MLSYSTGNSGLGEDVELVKEATNYIKEYNNSIVIDGPIQYDAAGDYSAILGGQNNNVDAAATNAVVIGGSGLNNTVANTVMVPAIVVASTTTPSSPQAGTIYFDGTHFYGYDGSNWKQLDN
jgi:phosphate acetyltransferase